MKSRIFALSKSFSGFLKGPKLFPKITYSSQPSRCDAHMNELPVPCGPWDEFYKERQAWYTKWLLFGITWWLFSFFMMIHTDSVFLNWGPPALPAPSNEADDDDGC